MARRNLTVPATCAGVLRISDEKTLQLVQLYAEEECLWNPNCIGYKNRETRHLAAQRIATILDLPNFKAHHAMTKFKNLRNSYSQELKKIAASVALGEEYRPKVQWFDTMNSFLRPFLRGSSAWLLRDERQNGDDDEISQPSSGSEEGAAPAAGSKRRRTSHGSPEGRGLAEVQAQLSALLARHEDQHATFGQHVASLMRDLPARRALALQPRILLLIAEELEAARASPCPPHAAPLDSEATFKVENVEIDESVGSVRFL